MEFNLTPSPTLSSPDTTRQLTPPVEPVPSHMSSHVDMSSALAKSTTNSSPVLEEIPSSSVKTVFHSSVSGDITPSSKNTPNPPPLFGNISSNDSETDIISSPKYSNYIPVHPWHDISSNDSETDTILLTEYSDITATKSVPHTVATEAPAKILAGTTGISTADEPAEHHSPQAIFDTHFDSNYGEIQDVDIFSYLNVSLISKLGRGADCIVYKAQNNSTSEFHAAKMFTYISPNEDENRKKLQTFRQETSILQALDHERIVKLSFPITGPTYGVLFLDYYPKGSLHDHLRNTSDELITGYFTNLLDALEHIHSRGIIHRDIKPRNILVADKGLVLTDFGVSTKISLKDNYSVTGYVGTHAFMAPEIKASKRRSGQIYYDGVKADSYALGITLGCILLKMKPKKYIDYSYLKKHFPHDNPCDKVLVECARLLLLDEPAERLSPTALRKCLADAFLEKKYSLF